MTTEEIVKRIKEWEDKIDKCDTCQELNKLQNIILEQLAELNKSLNEQLGVIQNKIKPIYDAVSPLLNINISSNFDSVIKAIQSVINAIKSMTEPIMNLYDRIQEIQNNVALVTNAITSLTAKIIQKSSTLGCKI